ncbi:hypothetical protein CERZMDRAFT_90455 [Cercospora zeae-maydis SCOH1-5]|uniref:Uncharacterized protein n=1 Tax=Cercospora zeae-maydis SCOH1-5 TaxID=717836 RepID=A0A6A6FJ19_9PEZI|nr:hypothetical protein CERZMDRAFT_90455 [Cercospora zeae-maydis SCOH1-5]
MLRTLRSVRDKLKRSASLCRQREGDTLPVKTSAAIRTSERPESIFAGFLLQMRRVLATLKLRRNECSLANQHVLRWPPRRM